MSMLLSEQQSNEVAERKNAFLEIPRKGSDENRDVTQQEPNWWNLRLLTNLFIVVLPFALTSYDASITGPLLSLPLFIQKYQTSVSSPAFTARNLNLLVCVPLCGPVIGLTIAPQLQKTLGRKRTLLIGYFCFCVPGSFIQLFAPDMAGLVSGLIVKNIGLALGCMTAPLFSSELVPRAFRGRATGLCALTYLCMQILGATLVWGTEKLDNQFQYKIPYAVEASLSCVFGLITFLVSESPVWYLLQGKTHEAEDTFDSIRSGDPFAKSREFENLKLGILAAETDKNKTNIYEIFNRSNLRRTIVAGAYQPFDQVSGRVLVTTFATVLLVQSGVKDPFKINILMNCLAMVGQLLGAEVIDRVGRRLLVLSGMLVLLLVNVAIGTLAAFGLRSNAQRQALAALFIILHFVVPLTFGSIVCLLPVELPKTRLREPTVAWTQLWAVITNIALMYAVPQMITKDAGNLGAKAAYVFGGCNVLMILFSYFYLPETKGLSLSDIDTLYMAKVPARRWTSYVQKSEQSQNYSEG